MESLSPDSRQLAGDTPKITYFWVHRTYVGITPRKQGWAKYWALGRALGALLGTWLDYGWRQGLTFQAPPPQLGFFSAPNLAQR